MQVKETKFLGVIINEFLSLTKSHNNNQTKVSKSLGVIRHIKKDVPYSVLKMLYQTIGLIQSYFDYCNIVWTIHKTTVLNDLFVCQKSYIRVITNSKWNAHTKNYYI